MLELFLIGEFLLDMFTFIFLITRGEEVERRVPDELYLFINVRLLQEAVFEIVSFLSKF